MTLEPTTDLPPEKPRRWRRWLRVAWTLVFAVLTIVSCKFWMRSYQWFDTAGWNYYANKQIGISSSAGRIVFVSTQGLPDWQLNSNNMVPNGDWKPALRALEVQCFNVAGFGVAVTGRSMIYMPYWFATTIAAMLSTLVWFPWSRRFSLRTMLLLTTLVAVVMGAVVWLLGR